MNTYNFLNDIFHNPQEPENEQASSFLDISEFVFTDSYFNIENCSPEHPLFFQTEQPSKPEKVHEEAKRTKTANKCNGKSVHNKNVCYNICQKTIKVIKKNNYEEKLNEICERVGIKIEDFKENIFQTKKNLTGFKALSQYLETKSKESQVYKEFMKWFLSEKYLRHALIEGEMKDVKIYIEYKNEVILPLLS